MEVATALSAVPETFVTKKITNGFISIHCVRESECGLSSSFHFIKIMVLLYTLLGFALFDVLIGLPMWSWW